MIRTSLFAALACTAVALAQGSASAQEPSFAGKTVTLTIGYGPGSGNDVYGRLIARHIGKHIPGQRFYIATSDASPIRPARAAQRRATHS